MCRKRNPHAMQANDIYEGQSRDRGASFDSLLKQSLAGSQSSIKNRSERECCGVGPAALVWEGCGRPPP